MLLEQRLKAGPVLGFAIPSASVSLADLLARPELVAEVPSERVPELLGELRALEVRLLGRATAERSAHLEAPRAEHLLSVKQAAERLGMSADYLYRRASRLPFTVRYIRQRQGR